MRSRHTGYRSRRPTWQRWLPLLLWLMLVIIVLLLLVRFGSMSKLSSHAQTLDVLARVNLGMAAGMGAAFFAVLDTFMGAAP